MRDITIRDYIGYKKELTADEVKKLPAGSRVTVHSFDRFGNHQWLDMTVVQSGKKKVLVANDYYAGRIERQIKAETDRLCYTEVEDDQKRNN